VSPSDSKVTDDEETVMEEESDYSIPEAHREYEKILRQLESECRNHIKCEQQMKLHIECLQEKIDLMQKDHEKLKITESTVQTIKESFD